MSVRETLGSESFNGYIHDQNVTTVQTVVDAFDNRYGKGEARIDHNFAVLI